MTELLPLEEKMTENLSLLSLNIVFVYVCSIEVTLSTKPQEEETEGDVGLQLKVNFRDKAVQRNARLDGKWGSSENTLSFFPFAPGESFKVKVKEKIVGTKLRKVLDKHNIIDNFQSDFRKLNSMETAFLKVF